MKGPGGGTPYILKGPKGKGLISVILIDEFGREIVAKALTRTGPRGTEYAIKIKNKTLTLGKRN
jgi:hypothetical protein